MRIIACLLGILVFSGCQEGVEQTRESPILRVHAVRDYGATRHISHGTGFIIESRHGLVIATAAHTLAEKFDYLEFSCENKQKLDIKYGKIHIKDNDIALIEIQKSPYKPMNRGPLKLNENIRAIGYPKNGNMLETRGKIIDTRVKTTAKVEIGMSGGPILVPNNQVIGLITLLVIKDGIVYSVVSPVNDL